MQELFLSTPSVRRATKWGRLVSWAITISIHALREEGDTLVPSARSARRVFLSTPSVRRATVQSAFVI